MNNLEEDGMHNSSIHRMRRFKELFMANMVDTNLVIADLGSRDVNGSYKPLFANPKWKYVGVDIVSGPNVDVVINNIYDWKEISSDSIDIFISGQVFEHVEYIWMSIKEVYRVLKPSGLCCLIAPTGGVIHRFPVDCWRIQPDGWNALAKYSGLKPIVCQVNWESLPAWGDKSATWNDAVLIASK